MGGGGADCAGVHLHLIDLSGLIAGNAGSHKVLCQAMGRCMVAGHGFSEQAPQIPLLEDGQHDPHILVADIAKPVLAVHPHCRRIARLQLDHLIPGIHFQRP